MKYTLYCDGASRGNPGPSAAGFLVKDNNNEVLAREGVFLGQKTNNFAEYQAVIFALKKVKDLGGGFNDSIEVFVDSQLVSEQLNGFFKVKDSKIRELVMAIRVEEANFKNVYYQKIARVDNQEADKIVNEVLDQKLNGKV